MTFFALSGLLNALVFLLFGLFVYFKNPRGRLNRNLFFWCMPGFIWSTFYFIWQIETDPTLALVWTRLLMLGAIWVPVAYLNVIVVFLRVERENLGAVMLGYIFAVLFTVALPTPYIVQSVEPALGFDLWPKAGIIFWIFLIYFFVISLYGLYVSILKLRNANHKMRCRIFFLLFGGAISIIGGSTNFFLWYDIPIKPYGNIFASVYVPLTFYSIIRHRILESRADR